jgi:hypothetical protein
MRKVTRVSNARIIGLRTDPLALEAALARACELCDSVVFVAAKTCIGESRLICELAARGERDGAVIADDDQSVTGSSLRARGWGAAGARTQDDTSEHEAMLGPGAE